MVLGIFQEKIYLIISRRVRRLLNGDSFPPKKAINIQTGLLTFSLRLDALNLLALRCSMVLFVAVTAGKLGAGRRASQL